MGVPLYYNRKKSMGRHGAVKQRRIVMKVGTSTLTYPTGSLNFRRVEQLVNTIADMKNAGNEIVLVSSGAVAVGVSKLGLLERPKDMPGKQAAAAVGQCELMHIYDEMFSKYHQHTAQILLTKEDIAEAKRKENITNTFERLLQLGALPIVNENDTVATEEIQVGDNDTLSAIVAGLVQADLLVILSDIDGLYDSDPRKHPDAKRISRVDCITEEIRAMASGAGSAFGTGGMATKIKAAEIAVEKGCDMLIVNGEDPSILYDIMDQKPVGTLFKGR